MPLYDLECEECGRVQEIFCCINSLRPTIMSASCKDPLCGGKQKQIIRTGRAGDWFHSFVSEDFNGSPIEVTSRRHLKQLCKEHGVQSRALL
jgi:hypothetical protein